MTDLEAENASLRAERDEWRSECDELHDADEARLAEAVARAEVAEARIAAIESELDAGYPTAFTDEQREGFAWLEGNLRAALAAPVPPKEGE